MLKLNGIVTDFPHTLGLCLLSLCVHGTFRLMVLDQVIWQKNSGGICLPTSLHMCNSAVLAFLARFPSHSPSVSSPTLQTPIH